MNTKNILLLLGFLVLLALGVGVGFWVRTLVSQPRSRGTAEVTEDTFFSNTNTQQPSAFTNSNSPLPEAFLGTPQAIEWESLQPPVFTADSCFIDTESTCLPTYRDSEIQGRIELQNTRINANTNYWYQWLYGKVAAHSGDGLFAFYIPYTEQNRPFDHPNHLVNSYEFIFKTSLEKGFNPIWTYIILDSIYASAQAENANLGLTDTTIQFPLSDFLATYAQYRQDTSEVPAEFSSQLSDEIIWINESIALTTALAQYVSPNVLERVLLEHGSLEEKYLQFTQSTFTTATLEFSAGKTLNNSDFYVPGKTANESWIVCHRAQPHACTLRESGTASCLSLSFMKQLCSGYLLNL